MLGSEEFANLNWVASKRSLIKKSDIWALQVEMLNSKVYVYFWISGLSGKK